MDKASEALQILYNLAERFTGSEVANILTPPIEKELKAFNLIKQKHVNVRDLLLATTLDDYNIW